MTVAACAALVQRADPDRFLSVMAAPVAAREDLFPLYALNAEAARAPWATSEALIAEMRLQWWREVLEQAETDAPPRAHEVAAPLTETIRRHRLPIQPLDRMIAARQWDIYPEPFASADAFVTYLDDTAGGLLWTAALTQGTAAAEEEAVRKIGRAQGLANWCLAIPALRAAGRQPFDDPAELADLAQQTLDALPRRRHPQAAVLRSAWLAPLILSRVARAPERIEDGSLRPSDARARAALMARAAIGHW